MSINISIAVSEARELHFDRFRMVGAVMKQDKSDKEYIAMVGKRSTSDPFEINLSDVTISTALQSKHASSALRIWGWILLVIPCVAIAAVGTYMIWRPLPSNWIDASSEADKIEDFVCNIFMSSILWFFPIFWMVVLKRRTKVALKDNPKLGSK
jgi:hypothetical protein